MKKVDFNFIKEVFENALDLDGYALELNSKFEEVTDWDSLGHMRIILELEEKLNISFEIEEVIGVDTVQKVLDLANSKINID